MSSLRLLVVDDDSINRKLLRAQLEAQGRAVLEAENGIEALAVLEREPVDGIISDILMPHMDGFRLCREIRRSARHASIPFIVYTATYDSPSDRQLAMASGADEYVTKPAPIAELMSVLEQAAARDRSGTPPQARAADQDVLEQYSAALVRKLEDRNIELQGALKELHAAHAQIMELNRTLESRVEQRTAALAAANEELEAFTHSVSHDLRGPLRNVLGFAQRILESPEPAGEAARADLQRISSAARYMDQLIQDLLAFSQAGRAPLSSSELSLDALVDEAIAQLEPEVQGRPVRWVREPLPQVVADARLLRLVLLNLLGNALKYTRPRTPAVIEIGARREVRATLVFVRDNGVGFDMRDAAKLFGAFQRLHPTREFEGTGLGLASVQRIIARHGGRVGAQAAPDAGATFFFTLPDPEGAGVAQA